MREKKKERNEKEVENAGKARQAGVTAYKRMKRNDVKRKERGWREREKWREGERKERRKEMKGKRVTSGGDRKGKMEGGK